MENIKRVLLLFIVILLALFAITSCRSGIGNQNDESRGTGTAIRQTLPVDSSAAMQTVLTMQSTQATLTTQTSAAGLPTDTSTIVSGTLLGDYDDGSSFKMHGEGNYKAGWPDKYYELKDDLFALAENSIKSKDRRICIRGKKMNEEIRLAVSNTMSKDQ